MKNIKNYAAINDVPIIQDDGLNFLLNLVKKEGSINILELGTAIGYSSINMAKLNEDIRIDTIEKKTELYELAKKHIIEESKENQITAFNMDIDDYKTTKIYDLIFVDAAKAQYGKYIDQLYFNLKEGGVFICDNMEFHGFVKNPDLAKNRNTKALVKKIKKFYDKIIIDQRFENEYYQNIGDGILVLRKKKENTDEI